MITALTSALRTTTHLLRVGGQVLRFAVSHRNLMWLLVLLLAPLLLVLAAAVGAASPFVVYPFV